MRFRIWVIPTLAVVLIFPVKADLFSFSTGTPDGRIAIDARPAGPSTLKIGTADDFILSAKSTIINSASFYGLVPDSVPLSSIYDVGIAIYHMFPTDSQNPPSGNVTTRANSPSDTEFTSRDSGSSTLTFQASAQGTFSAGNSVVNGIHPLPNSLTGGEGPVSGQEVLVTTEFTNPIVLPAGHYFFAPEVALSNGTVTNTGGGAVTNDGGEAVTQMPGSFFGCRPMGRSSSLEICRRGLVTRIWNLTGCGWAPTSLGLDKTAVLPLNSIWPSPSTA